MKLDEKIIAEKMIGGEPIIRKNISSNNDIDLMTALNWYSHMTNEADANKWLTEYMKKNDYAKNQISDVVNSPFTSFKRVIACLCRMVSNGCVFTDEIKTNMDNRLETLIRETSRSGVVEQKPEKTTSVQDRIKVLADEHITEFSDTIFSWFHDQKLKIDFSAYDYLQKNQLSTQIVSHIKKYLLDKVINEFEEFIDGKDEQLNEAYGYLKNSRKKEIANKFKEIISDIDRYVGNTKASKPKTVRKKKVPDVEKQINNLKYQREFTKLKIKSIDPQNIIGAQQLWIYNTKYNQLTVFNAINSRGFSIKGTTIQDFDENTSEKKKIRKPEETIPKVLNGGKIVLKKLMSELSTKPIEVNGRVNEDTILLRALK